jgi:hypothetical protein
MTPTQIIAFADRKYNATSDGFFSEAEKLDLIYQAEMELAVEANVIESILTASTVADQQEYSFPTNMIAIKRIEYNGRKLEKINFREDDILTSYNQDTTASGTPASYMFFNEVIFLRPLPSAVGTLRILAYTEPAAKLITSVLDVPTRFHIDIVDYLLESYNAKDKNYQGAQFYGNKWEKAMDRAKRWQMKRKRTDSFAQAMPDESLSENVLGTVSRW